MKNLFFTLVFGSLISLLLTGCSKDEATVPVDQIITPTSTGFDRGNMVVANKPLMGRDKTGHLHPLITGGQFFIQVTQGDQVLKLLNYYYVTVDAEHTGGLDNEMILWQGEINEIGNLAWNLVEIGFGSGEGDDGNGNIVWTDGDQAGLLHPVKTTRRIVFES